MKQFFTCMAVLALGLTANAESLRLLSTIKGSEPGADQPQLMGQGISPDGRYVCGTVDQAMGMFVMDLQTNKCPLAPAEDEEGAKLNHVNNQGVAIGYNGPGVTFNVDGVETVLNVPDQKYKYIVGEDISNDGSVMVGSMLEKGTNAIYPVYSKDGSEWNILPAPPYDEMGDYAGDEGMARYVSSDGKIILGYVGHLGPAVIWRWNDSGYYECDPIYYGMTMLSRDDLSKDYQYFSPAALSDNGRYVLIQARENFNGTAGRMVPVVYDTVNGTFTEYLETQEVDTLQQGLFPISICDDGTFVGLVGASQFAYTNTFIMKADATQAELFIDAFPNYTEFFLMLDQMGYHVPIDMSADGRYILGYGYYTPDLYDDSPAYWLTYVLDTKGVAAVDGITEDAPASVADIFNLDGVRLNAPAKGINIIRMNDGSTRKVIR